jgi:uncharacterized protein (TIGR00255 family)
MTGYGRGAASEAGVAATVEVRAVNHRFLDLKLRGTTLPSAIEDAISARVRGAIDRGAITISVHVTRAIAAGELAIDPAAARRVHEVLTATATQLGIPGPDLALVLAQPGVIVAEAGGEADPPVLAALDRALAQLAQMRTAEGTALAAELATRLDELATIRTTLATLAASVPAHVARRLTDRVRKLLDDVGAGTIEPARLAQEVALLADRADVTEELVRLASHLDQARALLAASGAVGRRLDFLVQELARELNTIGSKSVLAEITAAVVEGKAVLEKIREQIQNVE